LWLEIENGDLMDIKKYMEEASRTDAPLKSLWRHDIHMTLGMVTEAGELADIFKKNLAYDKDIDWVNVREEIGDLMWYISNFCKAHNYNLEDILETNIAKLKVRYPEKFTEEKANNRNLQDERNILSQGN
jgi:NTP pyrophosphatase (non-canonical NTP hydrolase)